MGQRKHPPLAPSEIVEILGARGFTLHHTKGDHGYYLRVYEGRKYMVQVDMRCDVYGPGLMKRVLNESGMSREQFYCTTKSSAKKIGRPVASGEELASWRPT